MKRALLLLCCLAPAAFATSWETSAFHTDSGGLVKRGMTMTEVRRDAGEPLERVEIARGIDAGKAAGETRQVWTYRGADGYYDITFEGNRVTGIVVTPDR